MSWCSAVPPPSSRFTCSVGSSCKPEQARMRLNETMRNKHLAPSYANNKDERAAQVSVCLGTSSYDAPQY
jgi:hypothetical protein